MNYPVFSQLSRELGFRRHSKARPATARAEIRRTGIGETLPTRRDGRARSNRGSISGDAMAEAFRGAGLRRARLPIRALLLVPNSHRSAEQQAGSSFLLNLAEPPR